MLTGESGNLLEQYDYDAFGQPYFYNASGTVLTETAQGNRFLFTGREWLTELRGYDYRNRLYMPQLGRFLQPDPKRFLAGDYNLYRYCHNDPVNKTDPTGGGAGSGIKAYRAAEAVKAAKTEATVFRRGTFADEATGWEGNYVKGQQWATDNPHDSQLFAEVWPSDREYCEA